jgi:hypothetical protein
MPHTFSPFPTAEATRRKRAPRGGEITITYGEAPRTTGLTCHVTGCRGVAWYVTGVGAVRRGWCGAHRAEAQAAARREAGTLSPEALLASIRREL